MSNKSESEQFLTPLGVFGRYILEEVKTMKIEWTLYEEEGIDPIDPVGDITVTNGQTTIQVEATYLDSWFDALITGIKGVQTGSKVTVEIVEEPDLLRFEPSNGGVKISYKNTAIVVSRIDEFIQALKLAAKDFLLRLDQIKGCECNNLLNLIRDFLNNPSEEWFVPNSRVG
ncbi:MAG TPA: hypothetical protein DDZ80_03500 [Cyanobacteria bacterium UBA8803]|nr:hypothetical protein [Cyanobacteria bacterium UBA9273]HBL57635.1 hypothetical protein [Cyanobacteria bacterium UBA8803]